MSTSYEERKRKAQAAAPKQRNGKAIIAAVVVAALVIVGVVWAVLSQQDKKSETEAKIASATAPPNANADGSGIKVNPGKAKAGAPKVVIFQDFQCPICKHVEDQTGPAINELADSGQIALEYHMRTFMDVNLGDNVPHKESSLRASSAAGCADAAGYFRAFHDEVYKNQPAQEGDGYAQSLLTDTVPKAIGMSGDKLKGFQSCVADKKMDGFATKMESLAQKAGNTGTPQILVNGKDVTKQLMKPALEAVQNGTTMDPALVKQIILGAAKK